MHFPSPNKDENSDKRLNLLLPNYRFLPQYRRILTLPPLPTLTPMPQPPLLAMQLMMLRIRNATSFMQQDRQIRRNSIPGTDLTVATLSIVT